uniref:V-SNARE coiled-coil homology domain-containing protein n=1 Tax=Florenciella parvula TaxID=236787 RepID=A0A7S2BKP8_9STRA|mmetsp:Transcript_17707/g.37070  ORF Transcript_17707/g.37070 Transcript_17707/m.37070 type:complete len:236 (+) Transcript_17707:151-858(+)|eukprot:CAMPEP_0119469456 /NCGR_PEP_ID=MMETSP1344-20130328/2774_1 /TAXON_ID=236787 /ORGANISM="Florenciella parvula, Strain CCMP2471" /LENGTH=235 /DNA_ID=CAMNT_0007502015 /DNA_START=168 /DNA_END=875 /DNA_ORIENTATION=-
MKLLYALVARDRTVLAEFTDQSGNFPTVTRLLLGKINMLEEGRVSYLYDQYMFHYNVVDGIIYLCMTSADEGSDQVRLPYAFLDDIKTQFLGTYGDRAKTAIAFEMNGGFAPVLETRMQYYNDAGEEGLNAGLAGVQKVSDKLEKVKGVMVQNIEHILERGEKLELLVDKTDQLQSQAFQFQKTSQQLQRAMWLKKVKIYAVVAFVVILLAYVLSVVICGFTYEKCGNHPDKKHH